MPGIVGIITRGTAEGETRRQVGQMVEAMRHEKHYRTGQYSCGELGLHVGWVNHEGAFDDCMPLVSDDKSVVIVFQGEAFPDPVLRARVRSAGVPDRSKAHARWLIDLYAAQGEQFLQQLNGWFCGVVIDLRQRRVTLFNDRYGMGRVYFHQASDEFVFASEAKSLLRVRPALRAIDPARLAEYLRYNCVLGDESLFRGVSTLPAASAWTFGDSARPARSTYFDFAEWEQQDPLGEKEFFDRFVETAAATVPPYARDDGNVAFSLTAGLDTRAILAALGPENRGIPCYTFSGPWRELYDVKTARQLAAIHRQPFSVITADDRFLDRFGEYATRAVHVSDGTHDAFGAHDIYFNERAREVAPVRLTGKFGSEVVRVRNLVPSLAYDEGLLAPQIARALRELPHFRDVNPGMNPLTRVLTCEIPRHEYGRVAAEQSQLVQRTPYMDNALVQLMYRAPGRTRSQGDLQEDYVKAVSPEFASIPTNLGRFVPGGRWGNKVHYALLWALFKVEYIYLYATPHYLTRLDRSVEFLRPERLFGGRQKWEGYRVWSKTHFADFIQDTLGAAHCGYVDFLDRQTVQTMVARHVKGTHNYLNEINRALTLELICSTMIARTEVR